MAKKKADQCAVEIYHAKTIKQQVVADMEGLGTYKPEYDNIITIYADLLAQYDEAQKRFEESGRQYETYTAAGGT